MLGYNSVPDLSKPEKSRVQLENEAFDYFKKKGISLKWHKAILMLLPTQYQKFLDFCLKNELEINQLLDDLVFIRREMYSKILIESRSLNILIEWYEANNFFKEKK
jgi:hypothetical protein